LATTTPAGRHPAAQIGVGTRASYLRAPSERDTGAPGAAPAGSRLRWRAGLRRRRMLAPGAAEILDTRGRMT